MDIVKILNLPEKDNMRKAFANSQIFRTDTEARMSVLNDIKFPTPASKYYQSLREMNVHQCELANLRWDYEDKQQDIEILEADLEKYELELVDTTIPHKRKRLKAQIRKTEVAIKKEQFGLALMDRTAEGRRQEIQQWDKILNELEPELKELGIPLDDPDAHQKISYFIRHIRQAKNASPANMSGAEANNLIGQVITNARLIQEGGLTDALLNVLSEDDLAYIKRENILELTDGK
jgi:hypothetical protein